MENDLDPKFSGPAVPVMVVGTPSPKQAPLVGEVVSFQDCQGDLRWLLGSLNTTGHDVRKPENGLEGSNHKFEATFESKSLMEVNMPWEDYIWLDVSKRTHEVPGRLDNPD